MNNLFADDGGFIEVGRRVERFPDDVPFLNLFFIISINRRLVITCLVQQNQENVDQRCVCAWLAKLGVFLASSTHRMSLPRVGFRFAGLWRQLSLQRHVDAFSRWVLL